MGQQLHILHLLSRAGPGGVSRYVHDLSERLLVLGHRVTVAGRSGPEKEAFLASGIDWLELPLNGKPRQLLGCVARLTAFSHRQHVDVLHSHYRKSCVVGRLVSMASSRPHLFTLHAAPMPHGWVHRYLFGLGSDVHAPSAIMADWLRNQAGSKDDTIHVVPHGVDPDRWCDIDGGRDLARLELGIDQDATVAGFVGRLVHQKNPTWAVDALAATLHRNISCTLLMMGTGPLLKEVKRRIAEMGVADHVRLLPEGDPLLVYRACDLLLIPSAYEGFALVGAEAMSVGRPILRTKTGGWSEQVVSTKVGGGGACRASCLHSRCGQAVAEPRPIASDGRSRPIAHPAELHHRSRGRGDAQPLPRYAICLIYEQRKRRVLHQMTYKTLELDRPPTRAVSR